MITKPSTPFKNSLSLLPIALLGLILFAGLVYANWSLANRYGKGEEFLPAWNGARAFLFEQLDPYSDTIKERTQSMVYGRAAQEGESPLALGIPFPLLILYLPFALIPDALWARAAFMAVSELALLALILLSLRLLDWRPHGWFIVFFCVTWLASFFSVSAILSGSPAILVVLGILGAVQAIRAENDEVAGILLALVSFHWPAMILLWLFVIIGVYRARRGRVFVGFGMLWIILGGATLIAFMSTPGWFLSFVRALISNYQAHAGLGLVPILAQSPPSAFDKYLPIISLALLILLAVEWVGAWRGANPPRWMWVAGLSLAVTPLIGLRTTLSNLAPLAFSILCILPFARERWRGLGYLILSAYTLLLCALPYYVQSRFAHADPRAAELTYLLFIAFVIAGLYWVRWYAVRPPLTWADNVKRELRK